MKIIKCHLLLKAASLITFFYCAGHLSGYPWTPGLDDDALTLIQGMKSYQFDMNGSTRTYWEFYIGFGFIIGAFLCLQAVVLWQLSSIAKTAATKTRWVLVAFIASFGVNTLLSWKYFFAVPVVLAVIIAILLCLALLSIRKSEMVSGT